MLLVKQFLLRQFRDNPCVVSQEFRVELSSSCSQFPQCSFLYAFILFSLRCLTFLIWTPWDYFVLNILDPSPHLEVYFQGLQILHWQKISYAAGWPPNAGWPEKFLTDSKTVQGRWAYQGIYFSLRAGTVRIFWLAGLLDCCGQLIHVCIPFR